MKKYYPNKETMEIIPFDDANSIYGSHGHEIHYIDGIGSVCISCDTYEEASRFLERYLEMEKSHIDSLIEKYEHMKHLFKNKTKTFISNKEN